MLIFFEEFLKEMKKLQTLAVKSDTINKKIMADVKGTLSYQKL